MSSSFNPPATSKSQQSLEISNDSTHEPKIQSTLSGQAFSGKLPKQNVGGSSKMQWFNQFLDQPALKPALQNLIEKISRYETTPQNCHEVVGFTESTRPQIDTKFRSKFETSIPEGPARFSPYQISLLKHQIRVPDYQPPPYPQELRKVKHKRLATSLNNNEKDATWVASHLCHNRRCINPEHLRWEPSWMNRLRDNCSGGEPCVHRPDRCLAPHRHQSELIDWTEYIEICSNNSLDG